LIGLPLAIGLALVGVFFAWVSADPFWLSMGRGDAGTVTVTGCHPRGVGDRCVGRFVADNRAFTASEVFVSSLAPAARHRGANVPAKMLDKRSGWAYAGTERALHLRWLAGLGMVLLVGIGVGIATGVHRLRAEGARKVALLWAVSLGGPIVLYLGILGAAVLI
jgi:hypothetical protein